MINTRVEREIQRTQYRGSLFRIGEREAQALATTEDDTSVSTFVCNQKRCTTSKPICASAHGEPKSQFSELPDLNLGSAVVSHGRKVDVEFKFAGIADHFTDNLVVRQEVVPIKSVRCTWHHVGKNGAARRTEKVSFKDVGIRNVLPFYICWPSRRDAPATTSFAIQQRGEDRGRIESRPAEPVDGAGPRH